MVHDILPMSVFSGQFYDVTKVAMIRTKILAKFGYNLINTQVNFFKTSFYTKGRRGELIGKKSQPKELFQGWSCQTRWTGNWVEVRQFHWGGGGERGPSSSKTFNFSPLRFVKYTWWW
jgi:hypothetical protein